VANYHTVIWDWNGTLLDDVHLALRIANDIFAENGVARITRAHYTRIFDFPVKEYYERAGLFLSDSQYEQISERFCDEFEADLATAHLFPSVQPVLSAIGKRGLRQYVLSGTEHPRLARMLDRFEISSHFDGFKGMSDGLAHGKFFLLATGHQSFERLSKLDCPVFHSLVELQNHLLRPAD